MFTDKYKRDNEIVKPSDEFLDKLKLEMKKEEKNKKKYKLYTVSKVAALAAIIGILVISSDLFESYDVEKNQITQQAYTNEENDESLSQGKLFSNSSWYDSEMSREEIYKTFVERISSDTDLKKLSVSNTNNFMDSSNMDKDAIEGLVKLLVNGGLMDSNKYSKENPIYYMAEFNNGDIIKFIVYDEKYFECNEF